MKVHATHHILSHAEGPKALERCADACAVRVMDETVVAVLADGAGQSPAAREAARKIVSTLMAQVPARPAGWAPDRALCELAGTLNGALHAEGLARFGEPALVSTVVAVVIEGDRLYGLNAGDSRAYLVRDGAARQLSLDHADAEQTNVITRAVGLAAALEPAVFTETLRDGDVVMLCSDGVWGAGEFSLEAGADARALVEGAAARLRREARDDMSAVVIHLPETGSLHAEKARKLPVAGPLSAGQAVDGWTLVRALDPLARTWVAMQRVGADETAFEQQAVLKFAPEAARDNEQVLELFIRETWHATGMQGDFFVPAWPPPEPSCRYYLMSFVDAPSLESVLKTRRLAPDETAALGRFLAGAGEHLLRRDLIHGDIKPDNILVTGDPAKPTFKLVDLGSAAPVFAVTSRAGTASFLAPERFHGAPGVERTEIFAIGVTLYRALTGKLPFGEIERFQTPQFAPAKQPSALNTNTPPWLDAVIQRCLSLHPEGRYQHFSDLVFDLNNPGEVEAYGPAKAKSEGGRDPVLFYKVGFWFFAALSLALLALLVARRSH